MSLEKPLNGSHSGRVSNLELSRKPMLIAIRFAILSTIWIVFSDWAAGWLIADHLTLTVTQTIKGLLYVTVTTFLVYYLANNCFKEVGGKLLDVRLHETQNFLETVFSNLGEAVLLVEPATRTIKKCNSAVESIFGYTPEELTGKCTRMLHVDTQSYEDFAEQGEKELERKGVFRSTYRIRHKDGRVLETENTVVALHRDRGWQQGVVSIVRDVSGQKQAEEELSKSERRYRILAENTMEVIWAMNKELVFTYVNPSILRLSGYRQDEFIGTRLQDHCDEKNYSEFVQMVDKKKSRPPDNTDFVLQIRVWRKDGSSVPVEVHGRVVFDEEGDPAAVQGTTQDISERLALEAHLRQSQKLEAIGTLASGVAHEINNPIMAITSYSELLEEIGENNPDIQRFAVEIQKQTDKVNMIVKNLLGYARMEKSRKPAPVRLHEIMEATLSLIQMVMRQDQITVQVHVPDDLPDILCYSQQIQQVVMNLLTNARDALNQKYPEYDENKKILVTAGTVDKSGRQWVRLIVGDRGPGIEEDKRENLFVPFYTTKPEGKGTGLGLWIAHEIIKSHGGEIAIESAPGQYTEFIIDLPTKEAAREKKKEAQSSAES